MSPKTYSPRSRRLRFTSSPTRLASKRPWSRSAAHRPFPVGPTLVASRLGHVSVQSQNAVVPTPLFGRLEPAGDAHPDSGRRASSHARGRQPSTRSRLQRGGLKPPVLGPRASDAGKCPHPGNPRRTAAATRSGRQNGGGSDGLVLRGEPGPRDPASGRAGRPQPPRRASPPCPIPNPERPRGRAPAAAAPALGPAAAVQEPHCPLQVSPEPAPRVGLTLLPSPSRRGGGRRGPRPSPLAGAQGPRWSGGLGRPGPGLTGLLALT